MILLVRHAEPEGGRGRYIGRTDLPLSEAGRAKARQLARTLAPALANFPQTTLISSPLARCRETARPLAEALGLEPRTDEALAEIDLGRWEGLAMDEVRREQPAAFAARGRDLAHFRTPDGESFAQVRERAVAALIAIARGPLPAVAVTHAGVIRCVCCHARNLGLDSLFDFNPAHAHCTVLAPRDGRLELPAFNLPPAEVIPLLAARREQAT